MPRLPIEQLSQTVSTQSTGNRIDSRISGQPARDMQATGAALITLSGQLAKVQDTWQKAKVSNQYTTARNSRKGELADLLDRAEAETDHNKIDSYYEELGDLISKDVEIDDDGVKEVYNSEAELDSSLSQTRIRKTFRSKMINHQRGEILKDGSTSEEAYIGADEVMRANIRGSYLDRLKSNRDAGFIDEKVYQSELEDVKDWEFNRAMKMVGEDPQFVLDTLEQFEVEDKNQLNKIVDMAKTNIFRQDKIRSIATLHRQSENEAGFSEVVFNDPSTTIAEKTLILNVMDQQGEVSDKYAVETRRLLTSKKAMEQVNNAPISGQIIRTMHDAKIAYVKGGEAKQEVYLKKLRDIQATIMSTKELSMDERARLQGQLNAITAKSSSEATSGLENIMEGPKQSRTRKYSAPIEYFDQVLPESMRHEALRNYAARTYGAEVSPEESTRIMQDVSMTIMKDKRSAVQDTFDKAIEGVGELGDLAKGANFHNIKLKDGTTGLILMKDGKPVLRDGKPIVKRVK